MCNDFPRTKPPRRRPSLSSSAAVAASDPGIGCGAVSKHLRYEPSQLPGAITTSPNPFSNPVVTPDERELTGVRGMRQPKKFAVIRSHPILGGLHRHYVRFEFSVHIGPHSASSRAIAKGCHEARSGRRAFLRPEEVGRFRCRKENQRHSRALASREKFARFVRRDVTTA